jgi:hypothetical protein
MPTVTPAAYCQANIPLLTQILLWFFATSSPLCLLSQHYAAEATYRHLQTAYPLATIENDVKGTVHVFDSVLPARCTALWVQQ